MTALAPTVTNSPVRVCNAAAPTARPPLSGSTNTRTGISRFSMRIRSRIERCRSTRYSAFLTSLPSGMGSTYDPERCTRRTAYSPCSFFSNFTP